ncbi:hypothetical protein EJ110_NYTH56146 [Nymphaea thermarum]|nr:hypothetical protein EJ110_NYTH56146 [Nymphaea thermarum]
MKEPISETQALSLIRKNLAQPLKSLIRNAPIKTFTELIEQANSIEEGIEEGDFDGIIAPKYKEDVKKEGKTQLPTHFIANAGIRKDQSYKQDKEVPHKRNMQFSKGDDERKNKHPGWSYDRQFTPLSQSREKILEYLLIKETIVLPKVSEPPKMMGVNKEKLCKFHRAPGHDTEDCFVLKNIIQDLINKDLKICDDSTPEILRNPFPDHRKAAVAMITTGTPLPYHPQEHIRPYIGSSSHKLVQEPKSSPPTIDGVGPPPRDDRHKGLVSEPPKLKAKPDVTWRRIYPLANVSTARGKKVHKEAEEGHNAKRRDRSRLLLLDKSSPTERRHPPLDRRRLVAAPLSPSRSPTRPPFSPSCSPTRLPSLAHPVARPLVPRSHPVARALVSRLSLTQSLAHSSPAHRNRLLLNTSPVATCSATRRLLRHSPPAPPLAACSVRRCLLRRSPPAPPLAAYSVYICSLPVAARSTCRCPLALLSPALLVAASSTLRRSPPAPPLAACSATRRLLRPSPPAPPVATCSATCHQLCLHMLSSCCRSFNLSLPACPVVARSSSRRLHSSSRRPLCQLPPALCQSPPALCLSSSRCLLTSGRLSPLQLIACSLPALPVAACSVCEANTSSFVSLGEMKSSSFSSIISKMNGGNYEMWAMQVKRTLIAHDKEHLILEPEPVQKVGKYTTWFKDNSLVMVWIVGTLSQEIANEVLHKESAKDMWDSLAATYSQARNETRIMQLHHDIHQMRQDGRPLHTYYSSLKSMFERLNSYFPACKCEQQKAYREMLMVGVFLSGLDSVYESAKNQMLTSPSIPPIDEAYSRLSRIPIFAVTVRDTTFAMLATRGRGGPFFVRGRGGRGRGNAPTRPVCQFCNRIGHTIDKCWQKHGRPVFANQTVSTDSLEQQSSELRVDDILSQLRDLIGDRAHQVPDPPTSTVPTAASASSSGMSSAYTVCPATDTTDWLIDSGASTHLWEYPEHAIGPDIHELDKPIAQRKGKRKEEVQVGGLEDMVEAYREEGLRLPQAERAWLVRVGPGQGPDPDPTFMRKEPDARASPSPFPPFSCLPPERSRVSAEKKAEVVQAVAATEVDQATATVEAAAATATALGPLVEAIGDVRPVGCGYVIGRRPLYVLATGLACSERRRCKAPGYCCVLCLERGLPPSQPGCPREGRVSHLGLHTAKDECSTAAADEMDPYCYGPPRGLSLGCRPPMVCTCLCCTHRNCNTLKLKKMY